MTESSVQKIIQTAYSRFLENKQHNPRYGQKVMIAEITKALSQIDAAHKKAGPIIAIEAGTGTGKTLAYTLATIPLAQQNNKTLIISTATIALQEQIIEKDLPDLLQYSGLSFQFALAKGRSRYLCLSKCDTLLSANLEAANFSLFDIPDSVADNAHHHATCKQLIEALSAERWDGDRDHYTETIDDALWQSVSVKPGQCTGRHCPHFKACAFFKARDQLQKADVIVANHDLVLSDLALGGGVLLSAPKKSLYVFDEGHHLSTKTVSHAAGHMRIKSTVTWLGQMAKMTERMFLSAPNLTGELTQSAGELIVRLNGLAEVLLPMFTCCNAITNADSPLYRFANGYLPDEIMQQAKIVSAACASVQIPLITLIDALKAMVDSSESVHILPDVDAQSCLARLGFILNRMESYHQLWQYYSHLGSTTENDTLARWLSWHQDDREDIEVACSPILAADTLNDYLWSRAGGVVLTSATLTSLGHFDRYKAAVGLPDTALCSVVPSPFNHQDAAVLSIPKLAADPRQSAAHTQAVIDKMPELCRKSAATLVLFASRQQMHAVYEGLARALQKTILMQDALAKATLLRKHRKRIDAQNPSVIFGLASFAEGIDLPGHYCEHVIIAKLPFAAPNNPTEAALCEWVEARGGNAFMEIALPDASTRLIQACGRLLRTETDQGCITILDRRLVTQRYGALILRALPPFRQQIEADH